MDHEVLYRRVGEIMERLDETLSLNRPRTAGSDAYRSLNALRGDLRREWQEARDEGRTPGDTLDPEAPVAVASFCCDPGPSLADLIAALPAGYSITIAALDRED